MHIAEIRTVAKSLPLLRLNTHKSLILSYSADFSVIFTDKNAHLIHFVGLAYRGRWLLDIAYYLQNLLKQGGNEIPNIRAVLRIPNPSLVS